MQQCSDEFKSNENLKRHILSIHDNVKYNCNFCVETYTQVSNLKQHIHAVHEGVSYECDECDYKAVAEKRGNKTTKSQETCINKARWSKI